MLSQNGARLKIVLAQKERWDYAEFRSECEKVGQPVLPLGFWVQKVAMLTAGMLRWPDAPPEQAYQNFVHEMNEQTAQANQEHRNNRAQSVPSPVMPSTPFGADPDCGGCGGGIVI